SRDVLAKLEEMKSTQPEYENAIDASKLALQAEVYASMLTELGQNQANAQTHYEWTESGVAIKDAVDVIPNDMLTSVLSNLTVKSEMPLFASSQAAIANSTAALNIYRQGDFPSQTAEEDAQ
ncbi:MAG: hypothetical protein IJD48_03125, partial [Clostridia bacterium]|nr:hypothetical protein [Clostridia bacterium]